jgi:cytidylate kinase
MRARPVVAIDGPAGAGKSTVAQLLAERLGYVRIDTGALYRGIAHVAIEAGLDLEDEEEVAEVARRVRLEFRGSEKPRLYVDGVDREDQIRTPQVAQGASIVSKHPAVRAALLDLQRRLGAEGGVVLEGRDIGTVVFPDAEVKVFLTASQEERARRRVRDMKERGVEVDVEGTLAEIRERDARDSGRAVAPLRPAADAVEIDCTTMGIAAVVDRLESLVRRGGTSLG